MTRAILLAVEFGALAVVMAAVQIYDVLDLIDED